MNPRLQATKFNKRAGKKTPVIRLLTQGTDKVIFKVLPGGTVKAETLYGLPFIVSASYWPEQRLAWLKACGIGE